MEDPAKTLLGFGDEEKEFFREGVVQSRETAFANKSRIMVAHNETREICASFLIVDNDYEQDVL